MRKLTLRVPEGSLNTMTASCLRHSPAAVLCAVLLLAARTAAGADATTTFSPELAPGACCAIDVRKLWPTETAIGLKEVQRQVEEARAMSAAELHRHIHRKQAPVVIGPGGVPYLLDLHHMARMILQVDVSPEMFVVIRENWRTLSPVEFWKRMQERNWVYLNDEVGHGPIAPANLPKTIRAMRDDPYRSLAWAVRAKHGYADAATRYSDFQWANFFRTRIPDTTVHESFDEAVTNALALARSDAAKDLPGFVPPAAAAAPVESPVAQPDAAPAVPPSNP